MISEKYKHIAIGALIGAVTVSAYCYGKFREIRRALDFERAESKKLAYQLGKQFVKKRIGH
jgi:hypothetical protein